MQIALGVGYTIEVLGVYIEKVGVAKPLPLFSVVVAMVRERRRSDATHPRRAEPYRTDP